MSTRFNLFYYFLGFASCLFRTNYYNFLNCSSSPLCIIFKQNFEYKFFFPNSPFQYHNLTFVVYYSP